MDREKLRQEAVRVLKLNDRGRYTVPSGRLYPHQWAWDSAFHALGWMALDPDRGLQELELLMAGQWEDGRVPHIRFHDLSGQYFPGPDFWGTTNSSTISQPPVWATIARRMHERGADRTRLERLLPAFQASHRWFREQRDPLGWGLVAVTHPWESGMDNSPAWDGPLEAVDPTKAPPFRRVDQAIVGDAEQRPTDLQYQRYAALVKEIADNGFGASSFLVYDPFMTAVLARAEADLAWLCEQSGQVYQPSPFQLVERLWSAEHRRFLFYDCRADQPLDCEVLAAYMPLMTDLPAQVRAGCREALEERYRSPWGYPTVPPGSPHFDARRYWRGPVWINTNWLLGDRDRSLALVERSGCWEYFDPLTGDGLGAHDFGWTAALVLDMTF